MWSIVDHAILIGGASQLVAMCEPLALLGVAVKSRCRRAVRRADAFMSLRPKMGSVEDYEFYGLM